MAARRSRRSRVPPSRVDRRRVQLVHPRRARRRARLSTGAARAEPAARSCSPTSTRWRSASVPTARSTTPTSRPDRSSSTRGAADQLYTAGHRRGLHRARPRRVPRQTRSSSPSPPTPECGCRRRSCGAPARKAPDLVGQVAASPPPTGSMPRSAGPTVETVVGVGLVDRPFVERGPRAGSRAPRPRSRPGSTPRNSITWRPSSGGRMLPAPPARAARRSVPRARPSGAANAAARCWLRVGAVAPLQVVEVVEQLTGVAYVAAHRLVGPSHRVGVDAQVEVDELRDVLDDVVRVASTRAIVPVMRAPTTSWWWKLTPLGRTDASSASRRRGTARRGVPAARAACSPRPRSCARARPCGGGSDPVRAASWLSSGRNSSDRPVSASNQSPSLGSSTRISFESSSRMRSALTISSRWRSSPIAPTTSGSGTRPNSRDEARRPQHAQRIVEERHLGRERRAQSVPRGRRHRRMDRPTRARGRRSAIALTVKSRRDRSVAMSSAYSTSGLRLSGRYTSARNVVISNGVSSFRHPTVPKR